MAFDPGLDSMREAGIPATVGAYTGSSQQQIRLSLEAMAQKMREGRIDAGVKGWALDCLKRHGLDGRTGRTTSARQAEAIFNDFRAATVYASDPYGAESVQAAGATLCLRPNLCIHGGDCDDLTVGYGSLCLSIGLPVMIVKQNFGGDAQEHVLAAVYDGNDWQYADPSTNLPFGRALTARDEVWVDPMGPIGNLPEQEAQIVTLGRPFGQTPTAPSTWQLVTLGSATQPGKRYRLGVLIDPTLITPDRVQAVFSTNWIVQSAAATAEVTGGLQSWVIQGINRNVVQLTNSSGITYVAVAIEVPPATPATPGATTPTTAATPESNAIPFGAIALGTAAIALAGGIAWGMHLRGRRRAGRRRRR